MLFCDAQIQISRELVLCAIREKERVKLFFMFASWLEVVAFMKNILIHLIAVLRLYYAGRFFIFIQLD